MTEPFSGMGARVEGNLPNRETSMRSMVLVPAALLLWPAAALALRLDQQLAIPDLNDAWYSPTWGNVDITQSGDQITLATKSGRSFKGTISRDASKITLELKYAPKADEFLARIPPPVREEMVKEKVQVMLKGDLSEDENNIVAKYVDRHPHWDERNGEYTITSIEDREHDITFRRKGCRKKPMLIPDGLQNKGGLEYKGHDWTLRASISPDEGLVIQDVKLRKRYMANRMSVFGFKLENIFPDKICQLEPAGTAEKCRVRLVDFNVSPPGENLTVKATYAVDHIPKGSDACLLITQEYRFGPTIDPHIKPAERCEPFGEVTCARFWPLLRYEFQPENDNEQAHFQFKTSQRLHFLVDGRAVNSAMFAHDVDGLEAAATNKPDQGFLPSPIQIMGGNPLEDPRTFNVIEDGKAIPRSADNYHQTWKEEIEPPTIYAPGCPECVHIHWRWSSNVRTVKGYFPQLGDGSALVPKGSKQSVRLSVWGHQAGGLKYNSPILFYTAESSAASDVFFAHGGWFAPSLLRDLLTREAGGDRTKANIKQYSLEEGTLPHGRPLGADILFDFSSGQAATFHTFTLVGSTQDSGRRSLKDFELLSGDAISGPFQTIGKFQARNADGHQEFSFQPVTAKVFVVRPISSWGDQKRFEMYGLFGLMGFLTKDDQ